MAEVKEKFPGVQEILAGAQSDREKSKVSKDGLLIGSLHAALKSLKKDFNYEDPLSPAVSDNADYAKMFEKIAEDFKGLGKELLKMRSSYLPFELLDAVDLSNPGGKSKKISEIVDVDTTLESYENTFFRLLGMPSTADIRDKQLITVTKSGVKKTRKDDNDFSLTIDVLNNRARAIDDRLGHPSSTAYDFISGVIPSLDRLAEIKFTKIKELTEILVVIKDLARKTNMQNKKLAMSLHSLMNSHRGVSDKAEVRSQMREVDGLGSIFSTTPPQNSPSPISFLGRMLTISLEWLEPTLINNISNDMKKHLWNEHILGRKDATMMQLQESYNFWQYSYLLFPPVQDERVATCINEPSKMVAEPFLPESMRTVSGHKLKSTLLEAVIRIRLDIVSGFPQSGARLSDTGMSLATDGDERPITPDEMGLLEALLIVRLFSALHGFAKDAKTKIKAAWAAQHRSSKAPAENPPGESDHVKAPQEVKKKSPTELKLETLLLVEESLFLLFGDSSVPGALSHQEGVSRNAGVKGAHLMGAAMSVLDVPRRWAEQELGKVKQVQSKAGDKAGDQFTSNLRQQLGIAKGVGAIDLLAYLIALFTTTERNLLALLNKRQFEYLKAEYPKGFFDNFGLNSAGTGIEKIDTGAAVCDIAIRAYDAYQIFRYAVGDHTAGKSKKPTVDQK